WGGDGGPDRCGAGRDPGYALADADRRRDGVPRRVDPRDGAVATVQHPDRVVADCDVGRPEPDRDGGEDGAEPGIDSGNRVRKAVGNPDSSEAGGDSVRPCGAPTRRREANRRGDATARVEAEHAVVGAAGDPGGALAEGDAVD